MSPTRRTALVAGLFYLLTFVSIPTLGLYAVVKGAGYVTGPGPDSGAILGGFLETLVALAGIGTAVTIYPVVRRHGEGLALGFVAARTLEAAMIFLGVTSIVTLVSLRQATAVATDPSAAGTALVLAGSLGAAYNTAFLLGQSLMPGLNALLLGTLLLRSGLVPRVIPLIGLVGAPIHLTAVVLTYFGALDRISTATLLAALPIAVWEFSLGIYLVVKGFRTTALPETEASLGEQAKRVPSRVG